MGLRSAMCCNSSAAMPSLLPTQSSSDAFVFKTSYPMYLISVKNLLKLERLIPHQQAKDQGLVTEYSAETVGKVIGVSHQWLGRSEPDPNGDHLQTLQGLLRSMISGRFSSIEYHWLHALTFGLPAIKPKWKQVLAESYIWIDYVSLPQCNVHGPVDALTRQHVAQAIQSIPAYMERCSMLWVLAPTCQHKDTGEICNYATWRSRGWCRAEMLACTLAPTHIPCVVCTGVTATPFMVHLCDAGKMSLSEASFGCCELGHKFNGQTLACDKEKVHSVLRKMLQAKAHLLRFQGQFGLQLWWSAMQEVVFWGLPETTHAHMPRLNKTLAKILEKEDSEVTEARSKGRPVDILARQVRWDLTDDARRYRTGISLLTLAAMADDAVAVRELTAGPQKADPNLELKELGIELPYMHRGVTPVMLAMASAKSETIAALLDARADPYHKDTKGMDALQIACCRGRSDNVKFWLERFPDWQLERKALDMGIDAAAIACVSGVQKAPCLAVLFDAGAIMQKGDIWGSEGLMMALVCNNEDSEEGALRLLLARGCDPNIPWQAHDLKWSMMMKAVGLASRCSQSRVFMDLALMQGSAGLHFAAKRGDVKFIRILREAGALPIRNAAGQTPIDVARRFYGDAIPSLLEEALLGPVVVTSPAASPMPTLLNGTTRSDYHAGIAAEQQAPSKNDTEVADNDHAYPKDFVEIAEGAIVTSI